MTTFTTEQARQELDAVLHAAKSLGEVRIRGQDGQEYAVRRVDPKASALDVPGVALNLTAREIVSFIREGREPR